MFLHARTSLFELFLSKCDNYSVIQVRILFQFIKTDFSLFSPLPTYSSSMTPNSCLQQQAPSYSCMLPPASARGYDAALAYARAPPCPAAPQPAPHNGQFPNNGTSASTGEIYLFFFFSLSLFFPNEYALALTDFDQFYIYSPECFNSLTFIKRPQWHVIFNELFTGSLISNRSKSSVHNFNNNKDTKTQSFTGLHWSIRNVVT